MIRETHRWRGVSALALGAVGVGVLLRQPGILLGGIVGVAYAAFATQTGAPDLSLDITRDLDPADPEPGDTVSVTLSIENEGPLLTDLRVVDGVPDTLGVESGSPRLATALRRGKRASISYTVTAERGEHEFEPVFVAARNPSSSVEREERIQVDSRLTCVPHLRSMDSFPLRDQSVRRVGRLATGSGGAGVEFYAVREYQRGDALTRIDWGRRAKTGEFATIEFHEERAASVVLVLDGRQAAYVGNTEGEPVMERQVEAAGAVASALLADGDQVGLASLGPRWTWLGPGLGRDHRERLRRHLALEEAFAPVPPDGRFLPGLALRRLRKHLPTDAQVVFLTPLTDDAGVRFARQLEAQGNRVTVLSPDLTATESPGRTLAHVERWIRMRQLRERGMRVVDWDPDHPLAVAVKSAARGWAR
ncbi:MAG: DUF58 domain-containing protein [Halodesulfurarchaeum sp.]